jgi:enamine deaminase RidA (YjgF/YER057c/UK114 family)
VWRRGGQGHPADGPTDAAQGDRQWHHVPHAVWAADAPFTPAVQTGNLAGQTGTGAPGTVVPAGIEAETGVAEHQGRADKSGSSMDRVVKCIVSRADMKEWDAISGVYATFGATGSALNTGVEIDWMGVAK